MPLWQKIARLLLGGPLVLLVGCSAISTQPDLKRLYAVSASQQSSSPVVFIHGALTARLRTNNGGEEIWPGPISKFMFNRSQRIALKIDPERLEPVKDGTEAYALLNNIAGRPYYGEILQTLEQVGRYSPATPDRRNENGDRRYYIFLYDWRQDLVETAAQLDRFIDRVRQDYGDPKLKVDIVAHSMGGLIARYFLRYGGEDVLAAEQFQPTQAGASKVRKMILLATPNWGSISGLQVFMGGQRLGLVTLHPEIFATMPAAYQLLPHPDRDWMITPEGKKWDRDLYTAETWRTHQWSIFAPDARARIKKRFESEAQARHYVATLERYFEKNLERAKRFYRALSAPLHESPVRYVVFGGDCQLTPARCLVEQVDGVTRVRFRPRDVTNRLPGVDYERLMLEPGDGRVTKASLLARNSLDPSAGVAGDFPLAYSVFLCEGHRRLTANMSFQDNLLNILLSQDTTESRMHPNAVQRSEK